VNLYTDFDAKVCAWLGELVARGHLPPGEVRCTDVKEIVAHDLERFEQVHFFAGIGGWPHALALAGWRGPCWTASLPCQPFSDAGKRLGTDDERHLWPVFCELVAERRPPVLFGEQVASKAGREWLAGVRADLEALGYRVGAADLCAAGVGAPHIRQRLFWVADACFSGMERPQPRGGTGASRPWGWRGEADLRLVADTPFVAGDRWPQPLFRSVDDGLLDRVVALRAAGNAIVPQVAAEFVTAYMETCP
jgi:DNA (cytosine-5)-methyltransferase 1